MDCRSAPSGGGVVTGEKRLRLTYGELTFVAGDSFALVYATDPVVPTEVFSYPPVVGLRSILRQAAPGSLEVFRSTVVEPILDLLTAPVAS